MTSTQQASRIESEIKNWTGFKHFAVSFYMDAMQIATAVAGEKNPELAQIILDKAPTMMELFHLWQEIKRDKQ